MENEGVSEYQKRRVRGGGDGGGEGLGGGGGGEGSLEGVGDGAVVRFVRVFISQLFSPLAQKATALHLRYTPRSGGKE